MLVQVSLDCGRKAKRKRNPGRYGEVSIAHPCHCGNRHDTKAIETMNEHEQIPIRNLAFLRRLESFSDSESNEQRLRMQSMHFLS